MSGGRRESTTNKTRRDCKALHFSAPGAAKMRKDWFKAAPQSIRKLEPMPAALTGRQPWILRRGRARLCPPAAGRTWAVLHVLVPFSCIGASSSKKCTLVTYRHYKLFLKHNLAMHCYISENPNSAELHIKYKHKNVKNNHL